MNLQSATENQLLRSTPESQGVPSIGILNFIQAIEKDIHELHSFMLLRHGSVVAEAYWWPYRPGGIHTLFSLSKSFTATAVGLALDEGLLTLNDRVLSYFPEYAPATLDSSLDHLQVRHLLTMSCGHAQDTFEHLRSRPDGKWVKAFFDLPLEYEPGEHFVYNSGCTYVLSAILQKLTGQTILDYLQPRLFGPLGIECAAWESSPEGINCGGWGLSLTTEALARFGQLYLQKGQWHGRRILSEAWVESATCRQVATGINPANDRGQGYGYQFWRGRYNSYRGEGGFGQFCLVLPEQDAVLAVTGAVEGNMWAILDHVWEHLLPALKPFTLPGQPAQQAELAGKLAGLKLDPPPGDASSPRAAELTGKTYRMDENPLKIESVRFVFGEGLSKIELGMPAGFQQVIVAGKGQWVEGQMGSSGLGGQPVVCSGVWSAADTYLLTIRYFETAICDRHVFTFAGDRLTLSGEVNVSVGSTKYPPITGRQI